MSYGRQFIGQLETVENRSERFDWNRFKCMLEGSTLILEIFEPGDRDQLIFSITKGEYNGGLLYCSHGVISIIVPMMTDISIREATCDEQSHLAQYIPQSIRDVYNTRDDSADKYWIVIDCQEGTYFLWANGVGVGAKEAIARHPTLELYQERISQRPLWVGGPPLAEL